MRILILGDVVGRPGRRAVRELVPSLGKQEQIDLVIANAENAAGGMGVDIKSAGELFGAGVHVLTSGNHIWRKKEIYPYLEDHSNLFDPPIFLKARPVGGVSARAGQTGCGFNH
jgi:calcineurin-like phosphoesterase